MNLAAVKPSEAHYGEIWQQLSFLIRTTLNGVLNYSDYNSCCNTKKCQSKNSSDIHLLLEKN